MKKLIWTIVIMMSMAFMDASADNISALWRQYEDAQQKDLPQTQLEILGKIVANAEKTQAYGHLLKAEVLSVQVQSSISPDSLQSVVKAIVRRELSVREKNPVLSMVYSSVLGHVYRENDMLDEEADSISRSYYDRSLGNVDLLAGHKAMDYAPAVVAGEDSRVFNNDLLSMLALEAQRPEVAHDYYVRTGNRPAALLMALYMVVPYDIDVVRRGATEEAQKLDSLIALYGDLPECGEVAIERYEHFDSNVEKPRELIRFIDDALARWGTWKRMNELRNRRQELINPMFVAEMENSVMLPDREHVLKFQSIRNISKLQLTVSRLRLDATTSLSPDNAKDLQKLKAAIERKLVNETKTLAVHPDYEVFEDSIIMPALPLGTYLVEVATNVKTIKPQYALLFVTNLHVLSQELPSKQIRYAVVNATTGQPVPNARLVLADNYRDGKRETLTCKENGELIYRYTTRKPNSVRAYTDADKYLPESSRWNSFNFYNNFAGVVKKSLVYTDRSIYRPGQTVHVAVLAHTLKDGVETHAAARQTISLRLFNANYREVATQKVITDEYGSASADFVLPATGLTGRFHIENDYDHQSAWFHVEEYKRPTFEVEFPEVHQRYQPGDTVSVTAHARSYAGVGVQGARVKYRVERKPVFWWRVISARDDSREVLSEGETTTDADGAFQIDMPMSLPDWVLTPSERSKARFYQIVASVEVADQAGESHNGELSLPLGTRQTAFNCQLADKTLRDNPLSVMFSYKNAAGTDVDAMVQYRIDEGEWQTASANKPFSLDCSSMTSGKHQLKAVCNADSLMRDFIVFSLDDTKPCIETPEWFYQTASEFPRDGSPVTVQIGSSDTDVHILYTVISGEHLLESGVIDQSNAICTRRFTYSKDYGSGALITYAWVKEGKMYTQQASIARPFPDKRLMLRWETFRDRLTPGQQEEWTLRVTNPDGTPAKAQLMAVLYDKSLDQIRKHDWSFSPDLVAAMPYTAWRGMQRLPLYVSGAVFYKMLQTTPLLFNHFDDNVLSVTYRFVPPVLKYNREVMLSSKRLASVEYSMEQEPMVAMAKTGAFDVIGNDDGLEGTVAVTDEDEDMDDASSTQAQVRENLEETAFFYPALTADGDGRIAIRFTLPESVTTWQFIGLGHDQEMNYGFLRGESVARKDVMVQPNMPRFVRMGDHVRLSARIMNTTDQPLSGTATLELIDPETDKVVLRQHKKVSLDANATTTADFDFTPDGTRPLLVCRVTCAGKTFSDGEQHYLPVLPNAEMVVNTLPFTQNGAGIKDIDLTKLFPKGVKDKCMTVEYTNNPVWLMVQALSSVSAYSDKNAISQATAYYANSLGAYILGQSDNIRKTVEQWRLETGDETSLTSSLEKNQKLKSLVLDETPWVMDASRETDQKRQLAAFFDTNGLNYRLESNLKCLRELQNADGSWSWWPGMDGSTYMTVAVSKILVRLNAMTGKQNNTAAMLTKALGYLGTQMVEEVRRMRKLEKESGVKNLRPSETAVDVLYIWSLDGRKLSDKVQDARDYLVDHLARQTRDLTIYGKAVSAVVLARSGKPKQATEYLESIRQYSVYTEEMGRYFDTPKAYYSWRDYRIPTEVAAIEAIKAVASKDSATVEQMQRWLLQSKRTQAWDTPVNSADAVYAFLNSRTSLLERKEPAKILLNGKAMPLPRETAGLGYVKVSETGDDMRRLTVGKSSDGTSWGAVYAQFLQPVSEIGQSAEGLSVRRELRSVVTGKPLSGKDCHVGDRVKVRITIKAERDYDFVQVVDKRAACMEPVGQLSGYRWGYYCSPRDCTTNYYFDRLSKGEHVVETEYYVDRAGDYETGTCTVQCAYAPEYTARAASLSLQVK